MFPINALDQRDGTFLSNIGSRASAAPQLAVQDPVLISEIETLSSTIKELPHRNPTHVVNFGKEKQQNYQRFPNDASALEEQLRHKTHYQNTGTQTHDYHRSPSHRDHVVYIL